MKNIYFLLVIFLFPLCHQLQAQEGTKQLMPNSTDRLWLSFIGRNAPGSTDGFAGYNSSEDKRLNIYLNAGEKMYFGMKMRTSGLSDANTNIDRTTFRIKDPDGVTVQVNSNDQNVVPSSGTGHISNYTQAVTEPNGVRLNGNTISGGYDAYTFTAGKNGNYYIQFEVWTNNSHTTEQTNTNSRSTVMEYIDVTVTDASDNVITNSGNPNVSAGRLWAKEWVGLTNSFTDFKVKTDFFVYTADEFVNKVTYNMYPNGFNFIANSFGPTPTGEDAVRRQSTRNNSVLVGAAEYKIFLNDPDVNAFPSSSILPPVVKVWFEDILLYDYDYNRTPQVADLTLSTVSVTKNGVVGCSDSDVATFRIETSIAGRATILLDVNGDGFIAGSADRALYQDLTPGINYLLWDLKDGNGTVLTDGTFSASATFLARGPAHFPLRDVETLEGITASSIRPFNRLEPTLYWDDYQIDNPTGAKGSPNSTWGDDTGGGGMDATQLSQFEIGSTIPRVWTYDPSKNNGSDHYNGNLNTINTWFNAIDLGIPSFNYQIITDNTACNDGSLPIIGDIEKFGKQNQTISLTYTTPTNTTDSDFNSKFSDPNNLALDKIQILSLPNNGTLKLNSTDISVNQEINAVDLNNISFVPNTNWTGTTSFNWNGSNGTNYGQRQNGTVTININGIPTISSINTQNVCTSEFTSSIGFTIGDDLTNVASLTLSATSSNLTLVPISGITFGGNGANRSVIVTPTMNSTGSTDITIFVSDGTQTASSTFTVVVGPSLSFTGDTRVCQGDPLNLTAEEVGATITWTKPDNSTVSGQNLSIASMSAVDYGNYKLRVEKASCISELTFDIERFPDVSFTESTVACNGGNITLTASENVATSYSWRNASNTEVGTGQVLNIAAANGNQYKLIVEKDGCTNESALFTISTVTPPDNSLTVNASSSTICSGTSATITVESSVTGINYHLNNGSQNIGTAQAGTGSTLTFDTGTIISNTTFLIIATNNGTGCAITLSDTETINVQNPPNASISVDGSNICLGEDGTITIIGSQTGVTYEAFMNNTNVTSGNGTGNDLVLTIPSSNLNLNANAVTVQASINSCTISLANGATINVANPPSSDRQFDTQVCVDSGQPASISITDSEVGVSYQLRNNADNSAVGTAVAGTGESITLSSDPLTAAATFNILATGTAACNQSVSLNAIIEASINELSLSVAASQDTIFGGEEATIIATSGATNYTWTTRVERTNLPQDESIISGNNTSTINVAPVEDTWYIVTASDDKACSRTDSVLVAVRFEIFIPSLFSPNSDGNNDAFTIKTQSSSIQDLDFRVFDRAGNLVYETQDAVEATTTGWDGKNNGREQPISNYIWVIDGTFLNGQAIEYQGKNRGEINLIR